MMLMLYGCHSGEFVTGLLYMQSSRFDSRNCGIELGMIHVNFLCPESRVEDRQLHLDHDLDEGARWSSSGVHN
jgi:hypothetical protein